MKGWTVYYNDNSIYEYTSNDGDIRNTIIDLTENYKNKITYRCEEIGVIKIYMASELEADSYVQSQLQSIKEKSWAVEEIYITSSNIIKYATSTTYENVAADYPDYLTNDIINGIWSEPLPKLQKGNIYIGDDSSYNIEDYIGMFQDNVDLVSFNADLSSLTDGDNMFAGCSSLTSFTADLSSLTKSYNMFYNCTALTSFTSDLSSLTKSYHMFSYCSNLTSFTSDLSNLTNGTCMFLWCKNLSAFNFDLSSLDDGYMMFEDCKKLESFNGDLSSLTDGVRMFDGCENLTTFSSDLSSLTDAIHMFYGCTILNSFKCDLPSLT